MAAPTSTDELIKSLEHVDASKFASEGDRARVQQALHAALRRVQTPFDVGMEHAWVYPPMIAAIRTLIDAGLWKKWVAMGGQPTTVETLAKACDMEQTFLRLSAPGLDANTQMNPGEPLPGSSALTAL